MAGTASPLELGTLPVGRLLRQYAFPAIIAMTASSLYNMVDSIFIGQGVGPLAISGLAITFPFMNLSAAFGAMVGVGASTLISMRLGQKDYDSALHIFGNSISLTIVLSIAFSIVSLMFLDPVLRFFGASDATLPYAREYMFIILLGNVISHGFFTFNSLLRSSGHPNLAMNATILAVLINAALDPLFIYSFRMGIRGAAIATILAQTITLLWQIGVFRNPKEVIHFRRGTYKLNMKVVRETLTIGLSPFLMNTCSCLVVILINRGFREFGGDLAIGAFGIVNRISFLFIMIVVGINQGMQPIAGYNYGAQDFRRVLEVLRMTLFWGTVVTTLGFFVGELVPELCVRAFTTDRELMDLSVSGMRINVLFFPLIGMQMVTTNFFQSIGKAEKSIFLSLTRQLLFLIPLLLILPRFWGLDGVWYALPTSDAVACVVAGTMLVIEYRKLYKSGC